MATLTPSKIVPHLWFADKAVEAANFYVSLFPDSRVDSVTAHPGRHPERPGRFGPGHRVHARRSAVHGHQRRARSTRSTTPSHSW